MLEQFATAHRDALSSMSDLTKANQCPYCWCDMQLGRCRVVATNVRQVEAVSRHEGDIEEAEANTRQYRFETLTSSTIKTDGHGNQLVINGYPVIYDPEHDQEESYLTATSDTKSILRMRSHENDLALFVCHRCGSLLPRDIGQRWIGTVGVIGTQGSGKTHFLATALSAASREQSLAPLGVSRFYPDEQTNNRFHEHYWQPVFGARRQLRGTTEARGSAKREALYFRVDLKNQPRPRGLLSRLLEGAPPRMQQIGLLFHDLPGEQLRDPYERAGNLSFLRQASAFLVTIDPWGLPRVRQALSNKYPYLDADDLGFNQSGLLNGLADDLGEERLASVPTAFVLTKGDLILELLPELDDVFREEEAESAEKRIEEIVALGRVVREQVLPEIANPALLTAIERFPKATIHLTAALGSQPNADGRIPKIDPIRINDPLFAIIEQLRSG